MIVVDVGSAEQGPEESVRKLIQRFKPDALFGFDPQNGVKGFGSYLDCAIFRSPMAAWIYDGVVGFELSGITSGIPGDGPRSKEPLLATPCFDLAVFLEVLLSTGPVVLKLDCEGAEYPLLRHLHAREVDARLELVLVEWHTGKEIGGDYYAHGWDVDGRVRLRCPVEEW